MKLLAPPIQFRKPEPDRAPHHSEMGNLLPLNISIDKGRTDAKERRRSLDVDRSLKCLRAVLLNCNCVARHFSAFNRGACQRLNLYAMRWAPRDGGGPHAQPLADVIRRFQKVAKKFRNVSGDQADWRSFRKFQLFSRIFMRCTAADNINTGHKDG